MQGIFRRDSPPPSLAAREDNAAAIVLHASPALIARGRYEGRTAEPTRGDVVDRSHVESAVDHRDPSTTFAELAELIGESEGVVRFVHDQRERVKRASTLCPNADAKAISTMLRTVDERRVDDVLRQIKRPRIAEAGRSIPGFQPYRSMPATSNDRAVRRSSPTLHVPTAIRPNRDETNDVSARHPIGENVDVGIAPTNDGVAEASPARGEESVAPDSGGAARRKNQKETHGIRTDFSPEKIRAYRQEYERDFCGDEKKGSIKTPKAIDAILAHAMRHLRASHITTAIAVRTSHPELQDEVKACRVLPLRNYLGINNSANRGKLMTYFDNDPEAVVAASKGITKTAMADPETS